MNKTTPWTATEENEAMALRANNFTYTGIAAKLGRSTRAVEKKFAKLRKSGEEPASLTHGPAEKTCEELDAPEDREQYLREVKESADAPGRTWPAAHPKVEKTCEERAAYWKTEAHRLQGVLANQQHEKTAVDILVEKAVELAPIAYVPAKENIKFLGRKGGSEQSAVLMLSDTHIGQVVTPEQTLGMGGYNFEIFLRRLARLERSVFSILQDHTTSRIPEIVVAMLGDLLHGNLAHSVEAGQANTLFTQLYSAGHAIAQFLRNLSTIAPVRVHTAVGNHPRWGTQKKMPTDNRFSNFDQVLYAYIAALTRDTSVKFHLDEQPFSRFTVQGWNFLAGHGDHLRGGDKNLGIPNHAIGRNVSVHSQLAIKSGNPLPNYFLVGHLHRPITIPHTMGEFLVNGGFAGIDGYALMEAFNSSNPSQKFFLVHHKHGRSATYDLRLDFGDKTPHHYELPDKFCCR